MEVDDGMALSTRSSLQEVLQLIFPYLVRVDLLNSRLVCKDWNKSCQSYFKKSEKFRIALNHKKDWDGYVKFVCTNANAATTEQKCFLQPVMPIHLKLRIPDPRCYPPNYSDSEDSDTESDNVNVDVNEKKHIRNSKRFEAYIATIEKLQNLLGSAAACVRDLTIFYPQPYPEGFFEKLAKVLSDLSPWLEKLEIKLDSEFPANDGDWIVFPKVKHLHFAWFNGIPARQPEFKYIGRNTVWKFIQACPNLETLILGDIHEKDTKLWPEELPFPPPGIKSFEFTYIPSDWLLRKMQQHPSLPALQKLDLWSFCIIGNDNHKNIKEFRTCRYILSLFSPSLRSLSMPLFVQFPLSQSNGLPFFGGNKDKDYNVPFPIFPALKNLTIKKTDVNPIYINFKINPAAFPLLESVNIPFHTRINENLFEEFKTVKSLSLRFYLFGNYWDYDEEVRQINRVRNSGTMDKIEYFQKMFSNISTIAFKNDNIIEGLELGPLIKKELERFLQLPGASNIQVLELIDFEKNYLGEVLEQILHPPRLALENVRRNSLLDDRLLKIMKNLTPGSGCELKIKEEIVTLNQGRPDVCRTLAEQVKSAPFQNCLINVCKIRLVLNKRMQSLFTKECTFYSKDAEYQKTINAPKKLYLNVMMTFFPKLEEIEVSSIMFAKDAISRAERIERVRSKFPGLRINNI